MADWGLYAALRGQDNWAQRRADQQMEMQIHEKQLAREEKKTQQRMASETEINSYLDSFNDIDVLPEDQERIQAVERKARHNIVKGIANNNGDLARYMSSGGITDLGEYKRSIEQSGEVKTALANKDNMAKIIADKKAGRWFKPVQVEAEQFGEDGQPLLNEDGSPVMATETADIDRQLEMFKNGNIKSINYNGSDKKIAIDSMTFQKNFKDPKNKGGDNNVTTSDIMFYAMNKGASEEYANYLADSYIDRVNSGAPTWKWNAYTDEEIALKQAKTNKLNGGSGDSGVRKLNQFESIVKRMPKGGTRPMGIDRPFWEETLGMSKNTKTGVSQSRIPMVGLSSIPGSDKEYDLTKALSYTLSDDYVKGKDGKMYIKATAIFKADRDIASSNDGTPVSESFWFGANNDEKAAEEGFSYTNDIRDWGIDMDNEDIDAYRGTVLVPIDKYAKDQYVRDGLNKFRAITTQFEGASASVDKNDRHQLSEAQIQQIAKDNNVSTEAVLEYIAGTSNESQDSRVRKEDSYGTW
jgi:hypothetical protein